jgi:putative iron-regulated protein
MKKIIIGSAALLGVLIVACKKDEPTPTPTPPPVVTPDPHAAKKQQVKETYANLAFAMYDDSYQGVVNLKAAITTFLANKTAANFLACKTAWLNVREVYGLTETFRFVDGPIDNPADGPEGFINAWPMDEAFVDYVKGNATAGIINNPTAYPTIDEATLLGANENGSEVNISLGFHAIEFLLWGQDTLANDAGTRKYTDYLTTGLGSVATASNQARRSQYLSVAVSILESGLKKVRDAWDPNIASNYRVTFLAMDNAVALRKMFNSLSVMSGDELSGERMLVAYENEDQEDEHSCFSDNTHRDIYTNAKGMEDLYLGTYTRTNGTVVSGLSLRDLSALYDATKSADLTTAMKNSLVKINLMYTPFDQAIILPAEKPKVMNAIDALRDQDDKTRTMAKALGIEL